MVPAPIQAREIPSIQQQFLDERHIQLYTHPTTNLAALANPGGIFAPQNGAIIQGGPTVVTVLKTDQDLKVGFSRKLISLVQKQLRGFPLSKIYTKLLKVLTITQEKDNI